MALRSLQIALSEYQQKEPFAEDPAPKKKTGFVTIPSCRSSNQNGSADTPKTESNNNNINP